MLKLTDKYEHHHGQYSRAVFDIVSDKQNELEDFLSKHLEQFNYPKIWEGKLQLFEEHYEIAQALIRRYNLISVGEKLEADRIEFIETFGTEAIKTIVYATDYCPDHIDIHQYAGLVSAAKENFGPTAEFDERILALLNPKGHEQYGQAHLQIKLLRQLLFAE